MPNDGKITIKGGNVNSTDTGIYLNNGGLLTIEGGNITGNNYGIISYSNNIKTNIILGKKDGEVNPNIPNIKSNNGYGIYQQINSAYANSEVIFKYYDGTITGKLDSIHGVVSDTEEGQDIIITNTEEGEVVTLGTQEGVAYIGEDTNNLYNNLQSAVDAVEEGTITLLKDISLFNPINIPTSKKITINLNGNKIQTFSNEKAIQNEGELIITDTTENDEAKIFGYAEIIINNEENSKLFINKGTVECNQIGAKCIQNKGTVTITGGKINLIGSSSYGIYNEGEGTITIEQGIITSPAMSNPCGIYSNSNGEIRIVDGTINIQGTRNYNGCGINNIGNGTILVEGGNITTNDYGTGIYNNGTAELRIIDGNISRVANESTGNVIITGGIIENTNTYGLNNNSGTVTITGGSISGISNARGTVTIQGGNIIPKNASLCAVDNNNGTIIIEGGNILTENTSYSAAYGIMNYKIAIVKAGNISSCSAYGIYNRGTLTLGENEGDNPNTEVPNISGATYGIYNQDTFNYYDGKITGGELAISGTVTTIPDNYEIKYSDSQKTAILGLTGSFEGTILVGDTYYDSLETAVGIIANTSTKNDTIHICGAVNNISKAITIPEGVNITIELQGNSVTYKDVEVGIINNGTLRIIDYEDINAGNETEVSLMRNSSGTLIQNNGTLIIGKEGNLNSNSPKLEGSQAIVGNEATIYSGQVINLVTATNEGLKSAKYLSAGLEKQGIALSTTPQMKQTQEDWTNDKSNILIQADAIPVLDLYMQLDAIYADYTIEYYYNGALDESKTEKASAETETQITTYPEKNITGYKFEKTENLPLEVTTDESQNIIKVYYIKDNFNYTVEYYYDGIKNEEKTVTNQAEFESVISEYQDEIKEGYKLDRTENLPLTITAEEVNNIIKVYYIKRDDLSYTVNYLEKDTDNVIQEPKVVENQTFEDVIETGTEIIEIEGYTNGEADKERLTITTNEEENIINIYYTKRADIEYIIEYYYDGIKDEEKTVRNQAEFESVINEYQDEIKDGYKLEKTENLPLTITAEEVNNIIKVYYIKRNDLSYKVSYIDRETNEEIREQKVVENKTFEDVIETSTEIIEIEGYTNGEADKERLTITTNNEENIIKIYYTKRKDLSYTVNYLDENGEKIREPEVVENQEYGKVITAKEIAIEIEGHTYDESTEQETLTIGTDTSKNIINIYYIKRSDLKYTVNYLEKDTNEVIHEAKEEEGVYGGKIKAETEKIEIPGYTNATADKEEITIGTNEEENVINIYYEKRTDIKYKVEYYYNGEKDGSKTLEETATYLSTIDSYEDKIPEGYVLVEEKGIPLTIKAEEERNVIKVYYAKETKVTVKYLNKNTNEVIDEETIEGYVGKEITTEAKDFKNYVLVEEPEEKTLTMTEGGIVVRYYYVYVSKGVLEKHIDMDTGEILFNAIHEGNEGDPYTTEAKEIEGYDIIEEKLPENSAGEMEKELITVTYYYKKKEKVTITVKYIDKETKEEIEEEQIIEGYEGKEYKTEKKDISGYEFVETSGQTEGIMTINAEVNYYYQKVKVPSQDENTPNDNGGQTTDSTIINGKIPNAGISKQVVTTVIFIVIILIAIILVVLSIKVTIIDKNYKN